MRILQVVQRPQRRGAEVFAHDLRRALRSLGHEVSICYANDWEGPGRLPLEPGDTVLAGRSAPGKASALCKLIRRSPPDIVQVNGSDTVQIGALAAWMSPGRRWALVRRVIGDPKAWLRGKARQLFYRWVVSSRVDGLIAVCEAALSGLKETGMAHGPTVVIPRAVDPAELLPSGTRASIRLASETPVQVPVVTWIGSLSREKRPDRLLRVMELVRRSVPTAQTWILGDGPLREELQRALACSTGTGVHLLGHQDRVADFLIASDLLILTSDTEGVPGVILEAGLLAVPAVATRVGGVPECIVHSETGIVVAADDEIGMSAAVVNLLLDPITRTRLGGAAQDRVRLHFSLPEVSKKYVAFYQAVLENRLRHRSL